LAVTAIAKRGIDAQRGNHIPHAKVRAPPAAESPGSMTEPKTPLACYPCRTLPAPTDLRGRRDRPSSRGLPGGVDCLLGVASCLSASRLWKLEKAFLRAWEASRLAVEIHSH